MATSSAEVNEGTSVTKQTEPAGSTSTAVNPDPHGETNEEMHVDLDVEIDMRKDDFDGYVEGFGKIRAVKPLAII